MADVSPLHTLRYDQRAVGPLADVAAPPYDVIDAEMRAELAARSPFNVVEVDLPRAEGGDPYLHAETTFAAWRQQGIVVQEREPALWAMTQDYTGPDRAARTRRGFLCRVRVEDYGPGRIRAHERTHPAAKEDRLRLTRATRANLSPIFALYDDPEQSAWAALAPVTEGEPFGTVTDHEGTVHRIWRVGEAGVIEAVQRTLAGGELLIADGHHRYETARIYAEEVGGEGEHRHVLMFLCSLADPGLTVFAIHRLLSGLDERQLGALDEAVERLFDVEEVAPEELAPPPKASGIAFGYLDARSGRPLRLTLKDRSLAEQALADKPEPYRLLDTAVLEALVLGDALGMSEEDIAEQRGLGYSKSVEEVRRAVGAGEADAAFLVRPTPVERVREIAQAGEPMPPKTTYFYPKVPTGLVFNPLS